MLKIIQTRKIWLAFSGLLVALSIAALSIWGLNFGLDFTGGSLLEVKFNNYQPSIGEIQSSLQNAQASNLVIQTTDTGSFMIRFQESDPATHQKVMSNLSQMAGAKKGSVKEMQFDSIGPSIGQELKSKSFNAVVLVILVIVLFIGLAFRKVSKPVASWKYGVAAVVALVHDVLITLGVFSVLGHFYHVEINTPFIAAILTVLGYSVNDTIIVFDRIRENLPKSSADFATTVNNSLNQVLVRSVNTSFSAILALLAILFFGGKSIHDFALALVIGVFIGTYSSLFVASPTIVVWENFLRGRR